MFLCSNDKIFVASYADDSSICCFAKSPEKVITKLGWFLCPKLMFMDSRPRQSKVLKKSVSNVLCSVSNLLLFLQVSTMVKTHSWVLYLPKLMLFFVSVVRHAQSTQNNKFAILQQYLKKEARVKFEFVALK